MASLHSYRLRARNTAAASANKIHDDAIAHRYGFRGGLVPGVDVYAYMTHPVAEAWGRDWLARGTMRAHFSKPVYDGAEIVVEAREAPDPEGGPTAMLQVRSVDGDELATGRAGLPNEAPRLFDPRDYPHRPLPAYLPPASPVTLAAGTELGAVDAGFRSARAPEYLDDVGEHLAIYREAGLAHPGYLLRNANAVLVVNVALGPWIHVSSEAAHFGVVGDGDRVSTRGRVTGEWERKGHRFVELDVVVIADGDRPVMQVRHTAIYRPRAPDSSVAP